MIQKHRIARLTQKLIQAPSENPPGNEYEVAMLVKKELKDMGLDVSIYEYKRNRPNIIATLKGKTGKTLLLNTHIDTVPAGTGWKHPPFEGKIINNKIYGRGASDCKGNTASCIEAIRSLVETNTKLNGTLVFAATVDEEMGSKEGLKILIKKRILKPDAALIVDSDNFHIDIAQKGLIHFRITIRGKKAHGAYPHLGINAITRSSEIITKLSSMKLSHTPNTLLNPPTINVGTIKGGEKVNMVPDICEFGVDIRFLYGMSADRIISSVKAIIETVTRNYEISIDDIIDPVRIDKEDYLVKCLYESTESVRKKAQYAGSEGATMVALFSDINIPAIATGFGIKECMHATDEYALVDYLTDGAKIIEKTIKKYLGEEGNP